MPGNFNDLGVNLTETITCEQMFHLIALDTAKFNVIQDDSYMHLLPGSIKAVGALELFVERVIASTFMGFEQIEDPKTSKLIWMPTELGNHFRLTQKFYFYQFPPYIELSENVRLFLSAAEDIGYFHTRVQIAQGRSVPGSLGIDLFNTLVERIREKSNQRTFKQTKQKRLYAANKNYISAIGYVNGLLEQFRQLQLLRLECAVPHKDLEDYGANFAHDYLDAFLNNRRSNKLFSGLVGYVWKLEFSEPRGHYFHFFLFFKAFSIEDEADFTRQIGQYWVSIITKNMGGYQDCFSLNNKHRSSGLGYIFATGHKKREELRFAIYYLTMKDQYLRFRFKKDIRIFGRGRSSVTLSLTDADE